MLANKQEKKDEDKMSFISDSEYGITKKKTWFCNVKQRKAFEFDAVVEYCESLMIWWERDYLAIWREISIPNLLVEERRN